MYPLMNLVIIINSGDKPLNRSVFLSSYTSVTPPGIEDMRLTLLKSYVQYVLRIDLHLTLLVLPGRDLLLASMGSRQSRRLSALLAIKLQATYSKMTFGTHPKPDRGRVLIVSLLSHERASASCTAYYEEFVRYPSPLVFWRVGHVERCLRIP